MSGALLAVAAGLLLWPGATAGARARLAGLPAAGAGGRARWPGALPELPLLAGGTAVAVGAAVSSPLVAVLAGCCAAVAARGWAARRRVLREDRQLAALTEALGALAAELRGGRSLEAATATAVTACADEESGRALARAVRVPDPTGSATGDGPLAEALARISAAAPLSARTGCSLAAVLSAVEDDLRARRRHRAGLRSATAGPMASATVLAGLPLLGLAMGAGVGADPWDVLTNTGPGQVLLVLGVGLELGGLVWSRRLVRRAVR